MLKRGSGVYGLRNLYTEPPAEKAEPVAKVYPSVKRPLRELDDEDEIGAAHGALHAVCVMILVLCCVYIGIRFFDVDLMHEPPVEIGGVL